MLHGSVFTLQAPGTGCTSSSSASAQQSHSSQQPVTDEDSISIDALYKLIGATKSEQQSTLSTEQQAHVSKVQQQQQLQQAAAAEAATIGTWLAPPHQQHRANPEDGGGSTSSKRSAAAQQAAAVAAQPGAAAGAAQDTSETACFAVQDDQLPLQSGASSGRGKQRITQRKLDKCAEVLSVAGKLRGLCMDTLPDAGCDAQAQGQPADGAKQRGSRASCGSAGDDSSAINSAGANSGSSGAAAVLAARGERNGQGGNGAILRARHSAILHVAMMKAAAAADSLAAASVQHGQ
jgi:hypothetical protein